MNTRIRNGLPISPHFTFHELTNSLTIISRVRRALSQCLSMNRHVTYYSIDKLSQRIELASE